MTLFETVKSLENLAITQPSIRTVGDGDLYEFMTNPSLKYGVFYVTQNSHRSDDDTDYYTLNLFYIDRLTHNLESNYLQVQSQAITVLDNIITTFCDEYEIEYESKNFETFTEKFVDECCGAYATVTFAITKDIICGEDY